jgi:hypothetical protein
MHRRLPALGAALVLLLTACAAPARRFPRADVIWVDDDRHPISMPEEYWSSIYWDAADKSIFRPLSHFWLLQTVGEARNANALGEVPNSSWYTNRLALSRLSPEEIVRGPCNGPPLSDEGPWLARSGKVNGNNPGFAIEDTRTGRGYLVKFNSVRGGERATASDVIGSKIYWAAGFSTPCNQIIYFDPAILQVNDRSTKKDEFGRKSRLTEEDLRTAMRFAPRRADGKIRASASEFVPGKPLGPFTYEDLRADDPNDAIPHEDRRELRGANLLAAWLNHFDAREQNTFTTFIQAPGSSKGYVQHHYIDFGDCFGSVWPSDRMSRRFGHSYYLDFGHVLADLFTLGLIERPWDRAVKYPGDGPEFHYFDVANFAPDEWHDGYPNPSFSRMRDGDAFWATKIISRFSDEHIRQLVPLGQFSRQSDAHYLERVLIGRRDVIVRHYFDRMTALDVPKMRGMETCVEDLMVAGQYAAKADSFVEYRVAGQGGTGRWRRPAGWRGAHVCFDLRDQRGRDYLIVEARVRRTYQRRPARPVRYHFHVDGGELQLAGIERSP